MPPADLSDNNHSAFLFDFLGGNSDADFEVLDDASQTGVRLRDMIPRVRSVADSATISRDWVGATNLSTKATAVTFTTPASTDTTIPLGAEIVVIQTGAGQVTFAGGSGVTVSNDGLGLKLAAQQDKAVLVRTSATTYHLSGHPLAA